jgi:protein-tyrosine-phosphatase
MRKVLVVCSGNICRSPMAEGILRSLIEEAGLRDVEVRSAGTLGILGSPPADNAVRACREKGVDISELRSSALSGEILRWPDIVLGMEEGHLSACRSLVSGARPRLALLGSFGRPADPEIADPVGQGLNAFRECRDVLLACASAFVSGELQPADEKSKA